ncbi:MAG: uracil-DNA glycosylase [Crocinitomix sp.]|jgi:uracil-DNA glycosylase
MKDLLNEIGNCTICKDHLALGPRPVLSAHKKSKVLIIGQAPGTRVHKSGIPWDDQSGKRLRIWLGVDDVDFYDPAQFGIVPMGFCYPGKGKSGDLPPRKECAPQWHEQLFEKMDGIELILLIGQYAQKYYLGKTAKKNLTETVWNFGDYLPKYFVLPHPSPRNGIWLKKHDWFEKEVIPVLQNRIQQIFGK